MTIHNDKEIKKFNDTDITDEQAEQIFIKEMNKKAIQLGCHDTKILNSTGLTAVGQLSTAYDFNIFTLQASAYQEIANVWGQKSYNLHVLGQNARSLIVETSVASPSIDNYYKILGGKTGTVGFIKNLTAIIYTNNEIFVATIMRGSSDRFNDSKIAIDEAIKKDSNENYDVTKIGDANSSFSIIKYPKVNPVLLTNFRPEILLSKNETLKQNPANMMKVVTAIVMLENMENINNTITFNENDFVGESGVKLKVGDKITMRDALYTMLLSSSNDTAKAVARTIGHTINYNRMKNIIS